MSNATIEDPFDTDQLDNVKEILVEIGITVASKLLQVLVMLIIGLILIKIVRKVLGAALKRTKGMNETITGFLIHTVSGVLKLFLALAILDVVGVSILSFSVVFAAIGLGIGASFADFLGNTLAGIQIVIQKPISVGDYVNVGDGREGWVQEIRLTHTLLRALDSKVTFVPNSAMVSNPMVNSCYFDVIRLDIPIAIRYGEDIDVARKVLLAMADDHDKIIVDPAHVPCFLNTEWGADSVNFIMCVWVHKDHYWQLYFALREEAIRIFYEHGLEVPFPQRDCHIYNHDVPTPWAKLDEDKDAECEAIVQKFRELREGTPDEEVKSKRSFAKGVNSARAKFASIRKNISSKSRRKSDGRDEEEGEEGEELAEVIEEGEGEGVGEPVAEEEAGEEEAAAAAESTPSKHHKKSAASPAKSSKKSKKK
jgi:small conductance mechanosensitive channel